MRLIGTLSKSEHAERFSGFLTVQGIETKVEKEESGFDIWVCDEDQVNEAKLELRKFQEAPDNPIYKAAHEEALLQEKQKLDEMEQDIHLAKAAEDNKPERTAPSIPLTIILCIICSFIFLWMNTSEVSKMYVYSKLSFLDTQEPSELSLQSRFRDINKGEFWRVFTPAVMHEDVGHIVMNLACLVFLGGQIEMKRGTWKFGCLVLFAAIFSNVLQGGFGGINFLGISGVCFAAFGYLWMKTVFEPESDLFISEFTIIFGVAFILAGIFSLTKLMGLGEMANWAHVGGLVAGVLFAVIPVFFRNLRKRNETRKA